MFLICKDIIFISIFARIIFAAQNRTDMKILQLFLCLLALNASAGTITTETLLKELTDLRSLARYPSPEYELKQAGSYDRSSKLKGAPGWYTNDDWSMFDYVDHTDGRQEYVLMDTAGPGVIVRFWMTFSGENCGLGTLRIYVDNMKEPVLCGTAFDILSGGLVCDAPLSYSASPASPYNRRGHNLYYPILYSKRCKVTYESANVYCGTDPEKRRNSEHVYYNINYRKYAPGTKVIPFSTQEKKNNIALASSVNKTLASLDDYRPKAGAKTLKFNSTVRKGSDYRIEISGPKAVTRLLLSLKADNRAQALRSTVIEMTFDGKSTLWCPLGDFFGVGYKDLYSRTLMTSSSDKTFSSLWVMPFQNNCEIIFHNFGTQDVTIEDGSITTEPWKWDNRSMYFGANWRQQSHYFTGDGLGHSKPNDIAFTRLRGKGVYVGDAIALFDTSNGWWGEGDEKIYVDGEDFPSCFGTGTEDYYGYAWCKPEVFTDHPFIAQPSGSGNLSIGYTSNSRYRVLDRIPFSEQLDFDMEIWHWNESVLNYASSSFWYLSPDGECSMARDTAGVREAVALKRSDLICSKLTMSIEGEDLSVKSTSGGIVSVQTRNNSNWSGNNQFFWRNASNGDEANLCFDSPASGNFNLLCYFGVAPDYGIVDVYLNGRKLASGIDLLSRNVSSRMFDFGKCFINEGENTITFRFVSPAKNFSKCIMGLDKIVLTPQIFTIH